MPALSARVPITADHVVTLRDVRAFEDLGVGELVLVFPETELAKLVATIESFDREVVGALRA
jgi:hypothetical protein